MRAKGYTEAKIEEVKVSQLRFKKPTTEEMRLAQLLDDKEQDTEREIIISKVIETTSRHRDDVVIALHDCNYDPNKAIDILMDHDDLAKEEWQECGNTKKKKKTSAALDAAAENAEDLNAGDNLQNNISNAQRSGNRRSRGEKSGDRDNLKPKDRRPNRGREDRRSRTVGERHPLSGSNNNENASEFWPQNEHDSGQIRQKHRRNNEPGADETNEVMARRGGRGGSSSRGRSWYGGRGSGVSNGIGRGRHADRHQMQQLENTNAGSFTVGTWENSDSGGKSGARTGGTDDWDIDEWDGSLSQTQVFERSNATYGAIGARPAGGHSRTVDHQDNGASPSHSPSAGPIRLTLDNVMNVAGSRRKDGSGDGPSEAPTKSPRRTEKGGKSSTPQRQEKNAVASEQQRSQNHNQQPSVKNAGKSAPEPPVIILDNRGHLHGTHGSHPAATGASAGLANIRFGSGLDSIGLSAVGGSDTNGSLDGGAAQRQQNVSHAPSTKASVSASTSASRQHATAPPAGSSAVQFPSSPYQQSRSGASGEQQGSPVKPDVKAQGVDNSNKFQQQQQQQRQQTGHGGLPPGQQPPVGVMQTAAPGASRPQPNQAIAQGFSHGQDTAHGPFGGTGPANVAPGFHAPQQQQSFRPSSTSSKPAGLDPSSLSSRSSAQSPYQQQQHQKVHHPNSSADSYNVQSHHQQQIGAVARPSPQSSAASSTSAGIQPMLLHQATTAPVYTGGASNFSAGGSTSTKLTESMAKLNVQEVVKSPQRQAQQQQPQSAASVASSQSSQQQQPSHSAAQQQQGHHHPQPPAPATTSSSASAPGSTPSLDQNMMKFVPPPFVTSPYYVAQQQPPTSISSEYFNAAAVAAAGGNPPDINAIYQRSLLEQQQQQLHGQQQHGQQQQQQAAQQGGSQPTGAPSMIKPTAQDTRLAQEQLLNLQSQNAGTNPPIPPHSSAAGLPPGSVPPAFMTPQLFYPLMQLFAANPALMAPFLASQVPTQLAAAAPPPTADMKSQAQFLQAVGMSPFLHFTQQQQAQPGSSHPSLSNDDNIVSSSQHSSQSLGQQTQAHLGANDPIVVNQPPTGQHQHQSHQQHVSQHQSSRPPPGFLMPVRQSNAGMNIAPSNSSDGNLAGFRAFQQHQQGDKPSSAGGPPGLFGPGAPGAGQQAAFLATGGAQPRQPPQAGGVIKPQQSHMPYWNPNS